MAVGEYVGNGNPDGTSFGQSGEKISFYGATPTTKLGSTALATITTTTSAVAIINDLIDKLVTYGLVARS